MRGWKSESPLRVKSGRPPTSPEVRFVPFSGRIMLRLLTSVLCHTQKIQSRSQRTDSSALTACDGDYTRSIAAHLHFASCPNSYMLRGKQMEEAMGMLIIRHKVKDYGKWRPMFDKHSLMQKAALTIIFEVADHIGHPIASQ